jgi:uncharacterized protein YdaU (DUF1376 family)
MPLHIGDYLADTGHLTATEHGAYLLLIMHYWQNGHLPENERLIARIAKLNAEQWDESRDVLAMLFGPNWQHRRIDAELSKADDIIEKRRAASNARYAKHEKSKPNANALHVDSKCSDTRVPPLTDNIDTSSLRSDVCPEPKSAPASPTVIELPATQDQQVAITAADIAEWAKAFPGVDVPLKLQGIRQWLLANPKKRKTVRGMRTFVVQWLMRDQDRGGMTRHTGPPAPTPHQQRHQAAVDAFARHGKPTGASDDEFAGTTIDLADRDFRAH